jgi:hypothetical protein
MGSDVKRAQIFPGILLSRMVQFNALRDSKKRRKVAWMMHLTLYNIVQRNKLCLIASKALVILSSWRSPVILCECI